ncbi:putative membrane protein, partial [Escherichia coli 178850]
MIDFSHELPHFDLKTDFADSSPLPFSINTFNVFNICPFCYFINSYIDSISFKERKLLILNITYFFLKFIYT